MRPATVASARVVGATVALLLVPGAAVSAAIPAGAEDDDAANGYLGRPDVRDGDRRTTYRVRLERFRVHVHFLQRPEQCDGACEEGDVTVSGATLSGEGQIIRSRRRPHAGGGAFTFPAKLTQTTRTNRSPAPCTSSARVGNGGFESLDAVVRPNGRMRVLFNTTHLGYFLGPCGGPGEAGVQGTDAIPDRVFPAKVLRRRSAELVLRRSGTVEAQEYAIDYDYLVRVRITRTGRSRA